MCCGGFGGWLRTRVLCGWLGSSKPKKERKKERRAVYEISILNIYVYTRICIVYCIEVNLKILQTTYRLQRPRSQLSHVNHDKNHACSNSSSNLTIDLTWQAAPLIVGFPDSSRAKHASSPTGKEAPKGCCARACWQRLGGVAKAIPL